MTYKSEALTFLDTRMINLENAVKDRALYMASLLKKKIVTQEIMEKAFISIIEDCLK